MKLKWDWLDFGLGAMVGIALFAFEWLLIIFVFAQLYLDRTLWFGMSAVFFCVIAGFVPKSFDTPNIFPFSCGFASIYGIPWMLILYFSKGIEDPERAFFFPLIAGALCALGYALRESFESIRNHYY